MSLLYDCITVQKEQFSLKFTLGHFSFYTGVFDILSAAVFHALCTVPSYSLSVFGPCELGYTQPVRAMELFYHFHP